VKMATVLAVSRGSPLLLIVAADDSTVVERSLRELHEGGHRVRRRQVPCSWARTPTRTSALICPL
jgi:hypothetical protein